MPELRSRDQERAAFAWKEIEAARALLGAQPSDYKEYVNTAKGFPALVVGNGLMQALAFQKEKEGRRRAQVVGALLHGLAKDIPVQVPPNGDVFSAVMAKLHGGDTELYLRATEEALEFLRWVRQFAAALA